MPRNIDILPQPAQMRPIKIVGMGTSRTGTLGIYKALKILGYRPYHMIEMCQGGIPQMKLCQEAIEARFRPELGIQPYARTEFDKWFADYDCVLEVPSYLGTSFVEAYKDDPDVRFILTEREPAAFARSFNNTVGPFITAINKLPMSLLKHFDAFVWQFCIINELVYEMVARAAAPTDPKSTDNLQRHYRDYIASVKEVAPKDRLLVVRLEDGLGWEQICPFLGHDIPDIPYPRGNDPDEFKRIIGGFLSPGINKAMASVMAISAASVGTGLWLWRNL